MYVFVTKHGIRFLSAWDVTKHGDQCPSPTGVNWVDDMVSIDFMGGMYLPKVFTFKV